MNPAVCRDALKTAYLICYIPHGNSVGENVLMFVAVQEVRSCTSTCYITGPDWAPHNVEI